MCLPLYSPGDGPDAISCQCDQRLRTLRLPGSEEYGIMNDLISHVHDSGHLSGVNNVRDPIDDFMPSHPEPVIFCSCARE
jgi:hypothetical protein